MIKKRDLQFSVIVLLFTLIACASTPPSFVQVMEPTWSSIEIRPGLTYEEAWQKAVDIVAKRFELEIISKDGGYVRSAWIHTWWKQGELTEKYRVRVIIKFAADHEVVEVKSEAHYLKGDNWVVGTDTRLLQTVKTDIMGVIGRTTR